MNALVTVEQASTAGPHGEGRSVFSPRRQAEFLASLQLFGNVRLACRAARISAQTAYRQRRDARRPCAQRGRGGGVLSRGGGRAAQAL